MYKVLVLYLLYTNDIHNCEQKILGTFVEDAAVGRIHAEAAENLQTSISKIILHQEEKQHIPIRIIDAQILYFDAAKYLNINLDDFARKSI